MELQFNRGDEVLVRMKVLDIDASDNDLPYFVAARDGQPGSWVSGSKVFSVAGAPPQSGPAVDLSAAVLDVNVLDGLSRVHLERGDETLAQFNRESAVTFALAVLAKLNGPVGELATAALKVGRP